FAYGASPVLLLTENWVVYFAQVDVHCLLIGVEVDRAVVTFLAKSGSLDTTERGAKIADVVGVEPNHAGINILCEVVGALQVVGPDISGQSVAGVVGQLECFFVSIEGRNCNHRAEDLFLDDEARRGDVSKYCWLQEVSFREFFRALATGNQAGFFFADLDIGPNFVKMFWVNQSTDFGLWIGWETNFDVGSLSCVALDEFIVNTALDQDT